MDEMGSFILSINRWIGKTEAETNTIIQEAVEDMCTRVIMSTPEDKSEDADDISIRGDWTSEVGNMPEAVNRGDATGVSATSELRQKIRAWKPVAGAPFYMANHRPYGIMLEYGLYNPGPKVVSGFSSQATQGMVGIHVQEFNGILEGKLRGRT